MSPRTIVPVLAASLLLSLGGIPRAARADEDPATAQLEFGVKMARRGLWSEALFRFKQAEELKPGNPRILNNIAVALEALGQFEQALEFYQRAVKAGGDAEMRKNYTRFVEFYRNFKPEADAAAEESRADGQPPATDDAVPSATGAAAAS